MRTGTVYLLEKQMIQELQKDDLGFFLIIIRADSLGMTNQ
jgi:hypothetical protein